MNVENTPAWVTGLAALSTFVREHETIKVTPSSLRVPKEFREEFYARVDQIERDLAAAVAGEELNRVLPLAEKLNAVRSRILENSNLRAYRLPATLENFLADPKLAVSRPALGLVLDALQHDLPAEELESRAAQIVHPFVRDLFRNAYEAWAYLSIVEAWHPVKFYGIVTRDTVNNIVTETDEVVMGAQVQHPERRLPETVFETADGRTIAIKTEVGLELDYYGTKVSKYKGYSSGGNTVDEVAHRVLLAYRFPSPEEVDVLADGGKTFVRPAGLFCTFLLPNEMENSCLVSSFVQRLRAVRSLQPVQVLTFDETGSFPDGMTEDPQVPKLERTAVGYDAQILQSIAAKLV